MQKQFFSSVPEEVGEFLLIFVKSQCFYSRWNTPGRECTSENIVYRGEWSDD